MRNWRQHLFKLSNACLARTTPNEQWFTLMPLFSMVAEVAWISQRGHLMYPLDKRNLRKKPGKLKTYCMKLTPCLLIHKRESTAKRQRQAVATVNPIVDTIQAHNWKLELVCLESTPKTLKKFSPLNFSTHNLHPNPKIGFLLIN